MAIIDKGLLMHWWHYYGKCIYTGSELKKFGEIIDKYGAERVLDAAVASFILEDGSPTMILMSIRKNLVEELFKSLPNIDEMEDSDKDCYLAVKQEFVSIISGTYR